MAQKKTEHTENPAGTTEKIRIKSVLRGAYGAFNPGETVEVEKTLAEAFVKGGFAEKAVLLKRRNKGGKNVYHSAGC